MLIQPITNQKYNNIKTTNQNPSFQGQLGEKVLQEITAKTPIKDMLKKLGIGTLGLVSVAKLKDILETWTTSFQVNTKIVEDLNSDLQQTQQELKIKSAEFVTQKEKLKTKEISLNQREKRLNVLSSSNEKLRDELYNKESLLRHKANELNYKEEDCNTRQTALEKQEKNLELKEKSMAEAIRKEVTAQIRIEEEEKAEKRISNIINALNEREQELNDREKTLLNTETFIKDAEIEKIKNEFRVIYNDDENIEINNATTFSLQLYAVTKMLKAFGWKTNSPIFYERLVKVMQNKEEIITNEMFQFVKNYVGHKLRLSHEDLLVSIVIMKDKNGNLDTERATHALAIVEGSSFPTGEDVINNVARYYKIPNPYQLDY